MPAQLFDAWFDESIVRSARYVAILRDGYDQAAIAQVDSEVDVMVYFRGEALARQRIDLIVDQKVIVESKATERLHPSGSAQLFSYLCATTLEVGLLLHFGRDARFHRVICENSLKRHAASRVAESRGLD